MHHLAAYYESQNNSDAYAFQTAVPDPEIFTSGDDIRVPQEIANIMAFAALDAAATSVASARFSSPTLRQLANPNVEPVVNAAVFGSIPEVSYFGKNPKAITGNESLRFETNSNGAGAKYGLVWLADGPVQPVDGEIFSIRGDASISLSAGAWVNGSITFEPTLPEGDYQVVGMRARGTNLVAARLVFPGGKYRPGVAAVNAIGDVGLDTFRFGRAGVFGVFNTNQPPTLDALGVTDSAQDIVLDLIKTG